MMRPKPVTAVLSIGLTPMFPTMLVVPVVETPLFERMTKPAAEPRFTAAGPFGCADAGGVEAGGVEAGVGPDAGVPEAGVALAGTGVVLAGAGVVGAMCDGLVAVGLTVVAVGAACCVVAVGVVPVGVVGDVSAGVAQPASARDATTSTRKMGVGLEWNMGSRIEITDDATSLDSVSGMRRVRGQGRRDASGNDRTVSPNAGLKKA
jgi:hypothetical protein